MTTTPAADRPHRNPGPAGQSARHSAGRLGLSLFGALAGLAGWMLSEGISSGLDGRLILVLAVLAGVFFFDAMALAGQIRLRAALLGAAGVALPLAALTFWASLRFDGAGAFLAADSAPAVAVLLLALLPMPFLVAAGQEREGTGWHDYPVLFHAAWSIVTRVAVAALFTGVVWGVIWLSDMLLSLVGIRLIGQVIGEVELVDWLVSGAVMGLGLAVVAEIAARVSTALRLLRLLLPPLLLVVAIFVAALPLRGLSHLFGDFSAATTLCLICIGAVTLISISIEARAEEAPQGRVLPLMIRAMALLLPVLALLAVVAVWLRVRDYGLTPARVSAGIVALLMAAYALVYALAALLPGLRRLAGRPGGDWMAALRRANIGLALLVMLVAGLWLTPLLDPTRLSTADQLARFGDGRVSAEALPLAEMRWDWGRAGQAGLARLQAEAADPAQAALRARLAALDAAPDRWRFRTTGTEAARAQLAASLLVRPAGAAVPGWLLAGASADALATWQAACDRRDAAGRAGCVLVLADLLPQRPGEEALLFLRGPGDRLQRQGFVADNPAAPTRAEAAVTDWLAPETAASPDAEAVLAALADGRFSLGPASVQALHLEGGEVLLQP